MRLVQTMDSMLAPSLPVQIGISGSSACLQIDVISGARRNPQSNFESTAVFLGSDPECDFILDKEFFPPMYAFLLVDSQGTVVRHLGDGPSLLLDLEIFFSTKAQGQHPADKDRAHGSISGRTQSRRPAWCSKPLQDFT